MCFKIIKKYKLNDYINNIGIILGFSFVIYNLICFLIFFFIFLKSIKIKIFKLYINITPKKNIIIFNNSSHNNKANKLKKTKKKQKYINGIDKNISKNNDKYSRNNKNEKFEFEINSFTKIHYEKLKNIESNISNVKFDYSFNDDNNIDKDDYNNLPFTQSLRLDKRNIFLTFANIFKMKIEIIIILFYPKKFTNTLLKLSTYFLNLLFNIL